jgi:hypothetical protein
MDVEPKFFTGFFVRQQVFSMVKNFAMPKRGRGLCKFSLEFTAAGVDEGFTFGQLVA